MLVHDSKSSNHMCIFFLIKKRLMQGATTLKYINKNQKEYKKEKGGLGQDLLEMYKPKIR
jgi:hypothetical protein